MQLIKVQYSHTFANAILEVNENSLKQHKI